MKARWIGVTGAVLALTALVLGILGPRLFPTAFWSSNYSGTMAPGMMSDGMMSGGMMSGGTMSGAMMNGGMTSGMMGSTAAGDPNLPFDHRFLDQMIMHHQGTVMSAQMMIADSTRPELRNLAQRIITGQQREIEQMRAWREEWYGATNAGSMPGMMGGMTTTLRTTVPNRAG